MITLKPESPEFFAAAGVCWLTDLFEDPFKPFTIVFGGSPYPSAYDWADRLIACTILDPRAIQISIEPLRRYYSIELAINEAEGVKDIYLRPQIRDVTQAFLVERHHADTWYTWTDLESQY